MDSNNSIPVEFSTSLEAIADQLYRLKIKYPIEFKNICNEALSTNEMTLGDAESGLNWACEYLAS
jgi:hypothetical protein